MFRWVTMLGMLGRSVCTEASLKRSSVRALNANCLDSVAVVPRSRELARLRLLGRVDATLAIESLALCCRLERLVGLELRRLPESGRDRDGPPVEDCDLLLAVEDWDAPEAVAGRRTAPALLADLTDAVATAPAVSLLATSSCLRRLVSRRHCNSAHDPAPAVTRRSGPAQARPAIREQWPKCSLARASGIKSGNLCSFTRPSSSPTAMSLATPCDSAMMAVVDL